MPNGKRQGDPDPMEPMEPSKPREPTEPEKPLVAPKPAPFKDDRTLSEVLDDPDTEIVLTSAEFSRHMNSHSEANIRLLRQSVQRALTNAHDLLYEEMERDPGERISDLVLRLVGQKIGFTDALEICDEMLRKHPGAV
jgi:hypothetical protein